mmetsp:Transcript_50173/g.162570  ORF Transcript_50173/g.162570 Transcript_50173/m.162570 type:complete len:244 (+) Transcript_50173:159-890(+)
MLTLFGTRHPLVAGGACALRRGSIAPLSREQPPLQRWGVHLLAPRPNQVHVHCTSYCRWHQDRVAVPTRRCRRRRLGRSLDCNRRHASPHLDGCKDSGVVRGGEASGRDRPHGARWADTLPPVRQEDVVDGATVSGRVLVDAWQPRVPERLQAEDALHRPAHVAFLVAGLGRGDVGAVRLLVAHHVGGVPVRVEVSDDHVGQPAQGDRRLDLEPLFAGKVPPSRVGEASSGEMHRRERDACTT